MAFLRSALVAAITRTSTGMRRVPPTRSISRSCSTRRIFAWRSTRRVAISSRNRVPRCASSNFPSFRATAPVKAPFSWPKSSDSMRVSEIAATFTGMNGSSRRGPSR